MDELVTASGFSFQRGAEPSDADIASIREKFLVVSRAEALVLGNRELFGRLAARAMLPSMEQTYHDWVPQLILPRAVRVRLGYRPATWSGCDRAGRHLSRRG